MTKQNIKATLPILLMLVALFSFCKEKTKEQPYSLSLSQKEGVDKVATVFMAPVRCYETLVNPTDSVRGLVLEIDSLSDLMKNFKPYPLSMSTNAAFLFYSLLTEDEHRAYPRIYVKLPYVLNGKHTYVFPVNMLDTVLGKVQLIESTMTLLRQRDYEGILASQWKPMSDSLQQAFLKSMKVSEERIGQMEGYMPIGLQFYNANQFNGKLFIRFRAILIGSRERVPFSLDLWADPKINRINAMTFDYRLE